MRSRRLRENDEINGCRFLAKNESPRFSISNYQATYRSTGGGWERHFTGCSDSDLHTIDNRIKFRRSLSPDKELLGEFVDSDMESVTSFTSSALSTQSERPKASLGLG